MPGRQRRAAHAGGGGGWAHALVTWTGHVAGRWGARARRLSPCGSRAPRGLAGPRAWPRGREARAAGPAWARARKVQQARRRSGGRGLAGGARAPRRAGEQHPKGVHRHTQAPWACGRSSHACASVPPTRMTARRARRPQHLPWPHARPRGSRPRAPRPHRACGASPASGRAISAARARGDPYPLLLGGTQAAPVRVRLHWASSAPLPAAPC